MKFATRWAGVHIGRLTLLALVAALVVGGIGGIDAVAERMLAAGASRMLADAEPAARTIRVVALEAPHDGAQDIDVRAAIATAFAGADIDVSRQSAAETAVTTSTGQAFTLQLLDDSRVPDLTTLTNGEWPQSPDQIALSDAAMERQRLGVGDTITVDRDGTALTIVGTWTADDPEDPAWHGDSIVASGENDGAIGPAIVADGALSDFPGTAKITWEIAPSGVGLADIAVLQQAITTLDGLPDVVDPQRQRNTRILGSLGDTLQRQTSAVVATRGLLVAPLLIIALLGALVLGLALTTLSITRGAELRLLRARGAAGRRLALGAAMEATVFVAAGAVVALAFLAVVVGTTATALLTAAGTIAFATVAAGLLTARSASGTDNVRSDGLGTRSLHLLLVLTGLVVGLAALSAWQLFATGSVVRSDGTPDPLAAAAPALLLIAACALAPAAAAPLAALAERLLRRTRGIAPILPLRQISRRTGSVAAAILCLTLAAASLALAVASPAAASGAGQRARAALLAEDVRMISDDGVDELAATAATWSGVTETAEMLRTPLTVGSDTAVLVAGPPDALGFADKIPPGARDSIAAGITRSLANRLGATEGTVFTARIRSVARPVSIEVARIVDALPGVGDGFGVAANAEELRVAGADLPANELWLRSDVPDETAAQLRAHATHSVRILTAAQVSATPIMSVAPALLTAGALVAVVLGVIGFLAASSATSRARRGEALVLRALGLRPSYQRALRMGETAGVAVYAVLVGSVLGAGVAVAVLPIILGVGS